MCYIIHLAILIGNETITTESETQFICQTQFVRFVLLFIILWSVALLTEVTIAAVALRGTIFNDEERKAAEYLLYLKLSEFR